MFIFFGEISVQIFPDFLLDFFFMVAFWEFFMYFVLWTACLCTPPNSYVETPIPSVLVFER